jgi:hypothetical protein
MENNINIENFNKLCAEFLGMTPHDQNIPNGWWHNKVKSHKYSSINFHSMKFHSNLDWLFQVKYEITKLGFVIKTTSTNTLSGKWIQHNITIQKNVIKDLIYNIHIVNYKSNYTNNESELNTLVKGINQFLIWYNQNKNV